MGKVANPVSVATAPTTETPAPPAISTGNVYYVAASDPNASDDNNGLHPTYQDGQDGPWLTIQRAASTMIAGDVTYVRAGTYYESGISFAHSGAPGAPTTLANYQSEEVVIDGSQSTDETPGIWIIEGRSHYVIQGFTIRNMGWSGITTDEETTETFRGITIRDCILHNNGWSGIELSAVDGVAGFAINSDSHHVLYRNNVAWRNGADWTGRGASSGFLCYEGCWHVEWVNNVAIENTDAGFWVKDELGLYGTPGDALLVFKNNITYNNGRPEWEQRPALIVKGAVWQVIATHNNWAVTPGWQGMVAGINLVGEGGNMFTADDINNGAFQAGNVSVEPQFVDADTPDVRLQPGSPMIDAGTDVGLPFCGPRPDMGAVEMCP